MKTGIVFLFFGLFSLAKQVPNPGLERFVEIKIKYAEENHIQLFFTNYSNIPSFSEKHSYWYKVTKTGSYEIVRWSLPDGHYKKFRIDLSTKANQEIDIAYLLINVNGHTIKLNGQEILRYFKPNIYLKLVSCSQESIKFRSIGINGFTDPWLFPLYDNIANHYGSTNTSFTLTLKSDISNTLAIKLVDQQNVYYGAATCYDSGYNKIELFLSLASPPKDLYIQPAISPFGNVELEEVTLAHGNDTLRWTGSELGQEFTVNGNYKSIARYQQNFSVSPEPKSKYSTFELWLNDFEFPSAYFKRLTIGLSVLLLLSLTFIVLNKRILT